jgi:hypothetical protein
MCSVLLTKRWACPPRPSSALQLTITPSGDSRIATRNSAARHAGRTRSSATQSTRRIAAGQAWRRLADRPVAPAPACRL